MSEYKGIKIVSDGTVMGTRVFSNEGEDITAKLAIRAIAWVHRVNGIPEAHLTCNLAEISADGINARYDSDLIDVSTLAHDTHEYQQRGASAADCEDCGNALTDITACGDSEQRLACFDYSVVTPSTGSVQRYAGCGKRTSRPFPRVVGTHV